MKKITSRLLTLVMAVLLLSSLVLNTSAMQHEASIANDASTGAQSIANFSAEDNAGVFSMRLAKGTDVFVFGAFLVRSGSEKYLISHVEAAYKVMDDYESTLMVPGGTNIPAYCVAYDEYWHIAYFQADGMEYYNALSFSSDPFDTTVALGLPYANDTKTECRRIEYKAFDFSKWTQNTEYLFSLKNSEAAYNWLGAPVFPNTNEYDVQGIGTCYTDAGGNTNLAIMNFSDLVLDADFALGAEPPAADEEPVRETDTPGEEDEPVKPEKPAIDKKFLLLIVVAVAIVAGVLISNKKKPGKDPIIDPGTIPVDPTIPADPIQPEHTHGVTRAVSNWQLRATGGPLNGKTFPLSGTMKIGRGSKCDIRFPDETPGVSGSHCQISVSGSTVTLTDTGSTYGTFVNGSRLTPNTPKTLHASDSFALAQNGITFRLENTGTPGGAQPAGPAVKDIEDKIYKAGASGRLSFGRDSGNTAVIASPDKQISSKHCVLYREGGKLYLMDVGSTNGTFFTADQRLKPNTPYRIRKGQAFFLCSPKYTFIVTEE